MTMSRAALGPSFVAITLGIVAACAPPSPSQPSRARAAAPPQPNAPGIDPASPRMTWLAPPPSGAPTRPATPTTSATPRWAASPPGTELYTAIEGLCPHLGVSQLEGATLVYYGGYTGKPLVAKLTDDGVEPVLVKLTPPDDVQYVQGIHGRWPDAAWVSYTNGARCSSSSRVRRIERGEWKPAFAQNGTGVVSSAAYGTGLIGIHECGSCGSSDEACGMGTFVSDGVKPPPMTGDGFTVSDYATLPTGEVYAIGQVCKKGPEGPNGVPGPLSCSGQFRWWSPGSKLGWDIVNATDAQGGMVLARSKTEVFVLQGAYLGLFDGRALKKLDVPNKPARSVHDAGADGVWITGEQKVVRRKSDGSYEDIALPPGGAGGFVGLPTGTVWAMGNGSIYRREAGGAWRKVELPRPVFTSSSTSFLTPTSIAMRGPDDVIVTASYYELAPGWSDREARVAILRTKKPKETLRCRDELDGTGVSPLTSWPATAGESCTTPLLVLAAVSAQSPPGFDYPQTRAILRPRADLIASAELREIHENGRRYITVAPRSVADGRTLAALYNKQLPLVHSEVVCAAPTVTRAIPLGK